MSRAGPLIVLTALGLTAAAPIAAPPPGPDLTPTAPAPMAHLVPGGLVQSQLIMVFPPAPRPAEGLAKLDRVALAVEGAESSYGRNPLMWRPDPDGPQGPMQVSAAAAVDVGGGDRFDLDQNRALGRAYLARMYTRYGNWRDALMAYNWGPGNLDQWIGAGRPADALNGGAADYALRVLDQSGPDDADLASPIAAAPPGPPPRPEVREDSIQDAQLRQRVHNNNQQITALRAVVELGALAATSAAGYSDKAIDWLKAQKIDPDQLAAGSAAAVRQLDEAGARTVLAIAREMARRPGDHDLGPAKALKGTPDLPSIRLIAGVLVEQLLDENDTLALIDQHRHGERADRLKPPHIRG